MGRTPIPEIEDRLTALLTTAVDRLGDAAVSARDGSVVDDAATPVRGELDLVVVARRPHRRRALLAIAAAVAVVTAGATTAAVVGSGDDPGDAGDIGVADDPTTTTAPPATVASDRAPELVVGTAPTGDDTLAVGDDEGFLALDPDEPDKIWSSPDGITWTSQPTVLPGVEDPFSLGGGGIAGLEMADGLLVAFTHGTDDPLVNRVWTSDDRGRTWRDVALAVELGPLAPLHERSVSIVDVAVADGQVLVAGTAVAGFDMGALVEAAVGANPERWSGAVDGDDLVVTSDELPGGEARIHLADFGLVPDDLLDSTVHPVLWRSGDGGGTWATAVDPAAVPIRVTALDAWAGGWVVSGTGHVDRSWEASFDLGPAGYAASSDGLTWTPLDVPPTVGPGRIEALGDGLAIWSDDRTSPDEDATIFVSPDGATWERHDLLVRDPGIPPNVPAGTPPDEVGAAMSYDVTRLRLGGNRSHPATAAGAAGAVASFVELHVDYTIDAEPQTPLVQPTAGPTRSWIEWSADGETWQRVELPAGEGARGLVVTEDRILVLSAPFFEFMTS
jgi:hypothetical protein